MRQSKRKAYAVRIQRLLAAGVAVCAAVGGAQAADWSNVKGQFGWFGVGKAYELDKGHYYWVGEFSGSFFNDKGPGGPFHLAGVKCPGTLELDMNKDVSKGVGHCIISDAQGDQVYLSWKNAGSVRAGTGTFEYTGGTGKYKGISGANTFSSGTQVNWVDGTTSGFAIWNR